MRVLNNGIGNNFGLVGKNIRRYLTTTALTATGLMAIASPALADNWTDHVATEGSISVDTTVPSTTNITQHTDFTKVQGDGDINAGWTVNVAQPSSTSKYVLYDTENDPTHIMGALNANGKIYIFDKNGTIFGRDSQVNVGSIINTTGVISDADIKAGRNNVVDATEGKIELNGTITVAESGLAAFVAPTVVNSGVINANAATVVLAAGEKVAIDLYGDKLVSITADGALEDALIENKGAINAAGGTVALSAAAAKSAVDNVINLDGVIDVSSVSTKGGKIILGGGNKGVVKVAGKLKADGATGGGSVKVTGENIHVTDTASISANATTVGNGGTVDVIADDGLVYAGNTSAKGGVLGGNGGAVDTSGKGWVDIYGTVDAAAYNGANGSWLIDPSNLTIVNGASSNVTGANPFSPTGGFFTSSRLSNTVLNAALTGGTNVKVTTVGSPNKFLQDGTIIVDANVTSAGNATLTLEAAGSIIVNAGKTIAAGIGKTLNVIFDSRSGNVAMENGSAVNTNGGNILVKALGPAVTVLGVPLTGNVFIDGVLNAAGGSIDVQQSGIFSGNANSVRTNGTGTINLQQNSYETFGFQLASIQNAIDSINNTGTGLNTITVSAGTFRESLKADHANLVLNGNNAGVDPTPDGAETGARNDETILKPNSPGVRITADNVTFDGFTIDGADNGVEVVGADNARVINNIIKNSKANGVYVSSSDFAYMLDNIIDTAVQNGVYLENSDSGWVQDNHIFNTGLNGIYSVDGTTMFRAHINTIENTGTNGGVETAAVWVEGGPNRITANLIEDADHGIVVKTSPKSFIDGNRVLETRDEGVFVELSKDTTISDNRIRNIGTGINNWDNDGIRVKQNSDGLLIANNQVGFGDGVLFINGNGIHVEDSTGGTVSGNQIDNLHAENQLLNTDDASGVYLEKSNGITVTDNYIRNADWDGIKMGGGAHHIITDNNIAHSTRIGIYGEGTTNATVLRNKVFDSNLEGHGGIELLDGESHDVGFNEVWNDTDSTGWHGIALGVTADDSVIHDNNVHDFSHHGIFVADSENVDVQRNIIDDTKGDGIHFKSGYGTIVNNDITDVAHGIYVDGVSSAKIRKNRINRTTEDGIEVTPSTNIIISKNEIDNTGVDGSFEKDGIHVDNIGGKLVIRKNLIGQKEGSTIRGNGIHVVNTGNGKVNKNTISNTVAESQELNSDDASGIYLDHSSNITARGNIIRNAQWDGIKMADGTGHQIMGNDIANSTRIGIYGEGTHKATVAGNTVYDSNLEGHGAIELLDGELHLVEGNDVSNAPTSTGWHGIRLSVFAEDSTVRNNTVRNFSHHGIMIENSDNTDVDSNIITNAGWDGIHAHGTDGYTFNNVLIRSNTISDTGDDGIEVHDGSGIIEIDGNNVSNSGVLNGFDEFDGGNDGITVRRISGAYGLIDDEPVDETELRVKALIGSYSPSVIRITNNQFFGEGGTSPGVVNSGDDGIEVVDADAYTYIVANSILNSGTVGIGTGPDGYGGDGIHVRNVYDSSYGYALPDLARVGDVGNGEYNIVISGNTVTNSDDDGVEVLGSSGSIYTLLRDGEYEEYFYGPTGRVLVSQNTITNSGLGTEELPVFKILEEGDVYGNGGDGIHVEGVYANYGAAAGAVVDGGYGGYAVDVLGNIVTNSGDDGIEVINSSSTLIDGNIVTNSGLDGGDYWGGDGIHVRNVGRSNILPSLLAYEGPGDGFQEYSVVIRRNTVTNSNDDGIQVHNDMYDWYGEDFKAASLFGYYGYTAPVLIGGELAGDGNTVTNSGNHGLYISGPGHDNVIVSGNAFANFDIGAEFESGLIDLTGATNTFSNGRIGLKFAPYGWSDGEPLPSFAKISLFDFGAYLDLVDDDDAGSTPYPTTPTNFGGTIGNQIFTGFTEAGDFYVYLDNGAFTNDDTPIWLNGLNSTYDGITPSATGGALSQDDFDFLEARFQHYPDNDTTDIFWFGFAVPETLAGIAQEDIFNYFDPFNGDITGLNVRITGLPRLPGQPGTGGTTPGALNNIQTFAGNSTNPADLNNIQTAAGGDDQSPTNLNAIDTAAGGDTGSNESCWSSAVNAAAGGQTVNVVYGGSFDSNLETAAACGTSF